MKQLFCVLLLFLSCALSAQHRAEGPCRVAGDRGSPRRLTAKELLSLSGTFVKPLSSYHGLEYRFGQGDSISLVEYGEQMDVLIQAGKRIGKKQYVVSLPGQYGNRVDFIVYALGTSHFLVEAAREKEFRALLVKTCAETRQDWLAYHRETGRTREEHLAFCILWTKSFFVATR